VKRGHLQRLSLFVGAGLLSFLISYAVLQYLRIEIDGLLLYSMTNAQTGYPWKVYYDNFAFALTVAVSVVLVLFGMGR
jgi:hypothetical protein